MGNGWFGVMDGLLPSLRSFQPRPLDGVKRECSSNRFGVWGSEFEVRSLRFGVLNSGGVASSIHGSSRTGA
jgi:hypothetical protein